MTHTAYDDTVQAIIANGGATFRYDITPPDTGYMVSLPDYQVEIDQEDFTAESLRRYMGVTFDLLHDHSDLYWGVWVDHEHDTVYLDISQHIPDRQEAIIAGDLHNQRAIFELDTGTLIHANPERIITS